MHRRFHFLAAIPCCQLLGCGTVLEVHEEFFEGRGPAREVEGIPFYKKVPRYRQETEYRLSALTADIALLDVVASPPRVVKAWRVVVADVRENYAALKELVRTYPTDPTHDIETTIGKLAPITANTPKLTANRIVIDSIVDRSRIYYLNSDRPFEGSGKLSFELSPDQTLVKGDATVEDKTLSTVLGALPIKEALEAALARVGDSFKADVTIERQTLEIYKFRKPLCGELGDPIDWAAKPPAGIEFELEVPKSAPPPAPPKKQYKFEGSVTLP